MPKSTPQIPSKDLTNTQDDRILHPWQYLEYRGEEDRTFIDKSDGIYLFDKTGKKLIDGPGGMWNVNVGHGVKEIADAVYEQITKMPYASPFTESTEIANNYASRLVKYAPGFTETIEEMEGAYDDWKRGQWSRNPYVDMCIPSKSDPTMAAPGKHYMSVFIQYVPFNLANGGWNEERKQEFGRHIVDCISEFSPNFKDLINHYEVRTPMDLDSEVGLTEGNIFQGELTMDQLMFNRPVPGYAQYRTPLKNMYICSSSTHPGGGVMGAPGANAAREVLLDMNIPQKGNYY